MAGVGDSPLRTAWVTGCFGFAGRHLTAELNRRGTRVIAIDRPGKEPPAWLAQAQAEPLELDLLDAQAVVAQLHRSAPSQVYHLAALSSAAESFQSPGATLRVNVEGTAGLLEGLRAHALSSPPPRLLAVGSCEEYGTPDDLGERPIAEDHPLRPASPYAVSKAAQTLLCLQYHRAYGLPVVCTRSFTHTGPGQSDRFVFSSFARQVAELEVQPPQAGGRIRVGNLEAVRDVSDVRDVVRAYVELLDLAEAGTVVNVCSGRGLRIREGLELLLRRAARPIPVEMDPTRLRPLDVPVFVGNAARLRSILGWIPQIPIERTLDDLLASWRQQLRAGS